MNLLERFFAYAKDFEKTYTDDDWSRLERYFAEDAVYCVENSPFACEVSGRTALLAAIRRSVNGFDRRCTRELSLNGAPSVEGNRVVLPWKGTYTYGDAPPLDISAVQTADYDDEGRITRLGDRYDPGVDERYAVWAEAHGQGLDLSYTDD